MNGKSLQELIYNLQVFYKCPSCGSQYRHEDITFLGRVDEHCFMQLTCDECSLPILATVLLGTQINKHTPSKNKKQPSISTKLASSDLIRGEKKHFNTLPPISAHEIADLHLYLINHSTDLNTTF